MSMDSRPETYEHIRQVNFFLNMIIKGLLERGIYHDQSKLVSPEVEVFDEYSGKLRDLTYGSDEYKASLKAMKPALDHHYANNSHHPEHHADGIQGMSLIDLVEMLADWKAATLRHKDGDLHASILSNADRFDIDWPLRNILINTAVDLGWM